MAIKIKPIIVFLLVSLCASFSGALGQDTAESAREEKVGLAFEQALKNYEAFKQKEQDEIAGKISISLTQVANEWIAQAERVKEGLLGTRLKQNWEKLSLYFPVSPSHYEYNLRGYKYSVVKKDVSKSDSITFPYKATVVIKEELYVEKYHSPDISDASPYFYTVSTAYNLDFEYKNDKLELLNSSSKVTNIENNAPEEIKKRTL